MLQETSFNKFLKTLDKVEHGSLKLTSPKGKEYFFEGRNQGAHADITIHDYSIITSLVAKGDIGFAEDYRDGKWDSSNLDALFQFAMKNEESLNNYIYGSGFYKLIANILYFFRRNNLKGSKRNISAHYDLGNEFYKLWLDESMTYSSAIFNNEAENLLLGQHNKYDRIIEKISDKPSNILEVGCGWGGFADRAISTKDHSVKGITLSTEQHKYATNRLSDFGENAKIVLEDYRKQDGKFDSIVSIEMFEAVGEKFWPVYFSKLGSLLKDKGKAVIQTITIDNKYFDSYKKSGDMIRSFIFPGGMLPSDNALQHEISKADLKITDKFDFGKDYAKTLGIWLENFDNKISQIKEMGFDEKFIRIWRLYLSSCMASFSVGRTNVTQVEINHA